MAEIVYGIGVSHGPLLSTPPEEWDLRGDQDRKNPALVFRDGTYDFASLSELRKGENFADQNRFEVRRERHQRCQDQIEKLSRDIAGVDFDVMVIVGDDQTEWFHSDIQPAFAVYCGEQVMNRVPQGEERRDIIERGSGYTLEANYPPEDQAYPGQPDLARHMIECAIEDEFDVTSSDRQPVAGHDVRGIGHAFGFIYRRILKDRPVPLVPVFVNTYFPPNQPTPKRCYEFGESLGRAIRSWPADKRVVVAASGGLSHFVVDEEWDLKILDAIAAGDAETLKREPNVLYRSGSSETKNWIVVAGMLAGSGLAMTVDDYVACYRTEAGTGCAMGFATWR